jgi:para-nitrobenzyl esterase
VRNAAQFSPKCEQPGAYPDDAPAEPTSEDCLYLNIWMPAGAHDEPLPVMIWVYGGGLVNGSASTPLYAGDELARRGVIVVTFNYRLGAFGFLAHPELSQEAAYGGSGNYGLLDQIAALSWVRDNIAAFGGDPDNVTVFGQSSGSISISALVASPMARDLFHRAIGQSGGLFEPVEVAPEFELEGAEQIGTAFAARLGAPSLEALRALPASAIVAQSFNPQPNVDGYVLRETPYEALANGRANDVDLLVGSNAEEGLYFLSGRQVTADNLSDVLRQDFPGFVVSLTGRNTFFYRFAHTSGGQEGATHGAEMAYVFGHLDLYDAPPTARDRALSQTMMSYWTNFARTGDPNGESLPRWPEFDRDTENVLLIDEADVRAAPVPNAAELGAIDRLYGAVRILLKYGVFIALALGAVSLWALWSLLRLCARLLRRRGRMAPAAR